MEAANKQEFKYAGFWIRYWAALMDSVLIILITYPVLFLIYGQSVFKVKFGGGATSFLINWVLPSIAVVLFWIYKQATPGKMAISAKIVDAKTGMAPSSAQMIGRYFAQLISIIPLALGYIWIAFDSKKQSWHDKIAGTVVIRKANPGPDPVRFNIDK